MAENNPSKLPAEEVKRIFGEIAVLKTEKRSLRKAEDKAGVKDRNEKIDALYAQLGTRKNGRGKSADSRATGTTVGTTESRETAQEHIQRWEETVKSLSEEIEEIKKQKGDEAAIKKLKKKISILNSKIKKKREKHNTGAATPRSIAQSLVSQLTALTGATGATARGSRQRRVKRDVARNGKVQIQCKTTNSMFPQLPPPILNEDSTDAIHKTCVYHNSVYEKTENLYSYEAFDYANKYPVARAFFIELEGKRKKRKKDEMYDFHDGYVAYVTDASYFKSDIDALRNLSDRPISGYLYMSANCAYKIDNKTENGFITFLIPFVKKTSASDTDETVCEIDVQIEIPSTTTNTVEGFVANFKKYIFTSNIPLEDGKTEITESVLNNLVKSLKKIKNATRTTLKRTDKGFKTCYSKPDVTVWNPVECKSADDTETLWKGMMKMVVPYSGAVETVVAREIIGRAMSQCQYALVQYRSEKKTDLNKEESVKFFEQIWGATVWILTIAMSQGKMNYKRIADLSTGITAKFIDIYKRYLQPVEQVSYLLSKRPDVPILALTNIIHDGEVKTAYIQGRFAAPKLPVVIPVTNPLDTTDRAVATAATQFRDW